MVDFEQGKYFMIKGTGNDIWDMLQENKNITPGEIIDKLLIWRKNVSSAYIV